MDSGGQESGHLPRQPLSNDVVPYPVSERELALRLDTIAGRRKAVEAISPSLVVGDLRVDIDTRRAWVGDGESALTALEFDLLVAILRASGRVLSRRELLVPVWRGRVGGETRTVDTHVKRLRMKLGHAAAYVGTVRGVAYRLAGPIPQQERRPRKSLSTGPRQRTPRSPKGEGRVTSRSRMGGMREMVDLWAHGEAGRCAATNE